MGRLQIAAEVHGQQVLQARQMFFDRGEMPATLVDPLILRSWERCRRFGLAESGMLPGFEFLDRVALKT